MMTNQIQIDGGLAERRQNQRVRINVTGRYMLEDHQDYECLVTEMSRGDMLLQTAKVGNVGERVIVYLDHFGRLEGTIERILADGFSLAVHGSDHKKDKLDAQLNWFINKDKHGLPEDRRHARMAPKNSNNVLRLDDGREYHCEIIDLSLSGAGIRLEIRPSIGTHVALGSMTGKIVRHFEDGVAIQFDDVQDQETLDQNFR
ncbi:PilZ domain-containing protein [Limoniibacter endophyticus]|uniref:Pilus assembly protein PilZ n=1 Tax=Limoniibacter endophyticus TaxID=1565040 RepID=A0A8J3DL16_9HYPH|nr:PilZ domain-containing protein [Limoniibacter endophyticus]GHC62640.1 pilus assembly protein PilZ [Limoniibacter endophyticus]